MDGFGASTFFVQGYLCVHVDGSRDECSSLLRLGHRLIFRPSPCALGLPLPLRLVGLFPLDHTVFLSRIFTQVDGARDERGKRGPNVECCAPRLQSNTRFAVAVYVERSTCCCASSTRSTLSPGFFEQVQQRSEVPPKHHKAALAIGDGFQQHSTPRIIQQQARDGRSFAAFHACSDYHHHHF